MCKKFRKKHVAQAVAIAFLGTGSVMSSAIASDVVSGQFQVITNDADPAAVTDQGVNPISFRVPAGETEVTVSCLLYTSPSPRDRTRSRMPSSA